MKVRRDRDLCRFAKDGYGTGVAAPSLWSPIQSLPEAHRRATRAKDSVKFATLHARSYWGQLRPALRLTGRHARNFLVDATSDGINFGPKETVKWVLAYAMPVFRRWTDVSVGHWRDRRTTTARSLAELCAGMNAARHRRNEKERWKTTMEGVEEGRKRRDGRAANTKRPEAEKSEPGGSLVAFAPIPRTSRRLSKFLLLLLLFC